MHCPAFHPDRDPGAAAPKLRPASHSYLAQSQVGVGALIVSLCGSLLYATVWLIRLLA